MTGELKKVFRPEFLNRVDEVIVFHDLNGEEIEQIVDLMVDRLRDQLGLQGFGITLTEEARKLLAQEGFDSTLGARPLRRAIQRLLEDPLSEQILAGNWRPATSSRSTSRTGRRSFRKGEGVVAVPARRAAEQPEAPSDKPASPRRSSSRTGGGKTSGGAAGE